MRERMYSEAEKKIVTRFLSGDNASFEWLYTCHIHQLYSYGHSLGFGDDLLKDAIQDVFFKILCKRTLLDPDRDPRFYLFRSLKNRLIDMRRTSKSTCGIDTSASAFRLDVTILDQQIESEERQRLERRIADLLNCITSDIQREAVYLRYMYEMEYDEIACLLNVTPHSARKLVSKGLQKIRSHNGLMLFYLLTTLFRAQL